MKELKALSVTHRRLVGVQKQLSVAARELLSFDKRNGSQAGKYSKNALAGIEKDLKKLETRIQQLIKEDPQLCELFNLITSVEGVGKVTAVEVILTTNEFKDLVDPSKYACYCGVAPFEHRSGTSIRGRTRVSHHANKTVKMLLHMAALSAIKVNADLKGYYERKVKEGKNKMLVINAIRRKLIDRIFACVRNKRSYQKIYSSTLV
jgi:transposase